MPKVTLRLRDLNSGDGSLGEHPDLASAAAWLRSRPRFVEVSGAFFDGMTREESDALRAAMRPLDEEEEARVRSLDEAEARARMERDVARRAEAEAALERERAAARTASPDRPMELHYRYDREHLTKVDAHDERPITDAARDAVMAWVHERMEWVAGRGQTVGEAKVTVFPTAVPPKSERVVGGSFVPIAAPPRGRN